MKLYLPQVYPNNLLELAPNFFGPNWGTTEPTWIDPALANSCAQPPAKDRKKKITAKTCGLEQ